jgi:putative PIG3 family NAD(P)H quinone oxidoreductase
MTSDALQMRAIDIGRPGGPEALVPVDMARPTPGPGEVLIAVAAAGVNRPDILQRQGAYPPPSGASPIPGLEVAGTIAARGPGVGRWRVGDRVTALVAGGGYAEFCVAPEGSVLPIPAGLSFVEAAALPETFFTVWSNVFDRAGLKPGETLLVHGGASGIGVAAILLGKAFGATVIVTAGTAEKCARCVELGADRAVNYRDEDFVAVVKEMTNGRGANVILDMVGGAYVGRNYEAAAVEGRIVQIAFLQGSKVEVDMQRIMLKRLVHTGSTLRARDPAFKAAIAAALEAKVWPLIAAGKIRPVIEATFPLAEAAEAHRHLEAGEHVGKVMLVL